VLAWAESTLVQPDGDSAGDPWRWSESQARFVAWFYALEADGTYRFRRAQVVLPKGAGKSPMAAAIGCIELAGPVMFDHWGDDGEPVMRSHTSPMVKLSALSQDQAEDATMSLAAAMLESPEAVLSIPGLDVGITRIRTRAGSLTSATARAPSKEGLRPTCVILDESGLWLQSNGGHRLAESLRRGLAKTDGRSIELTNRWVIGQDSVAERTDEYARAIRDGRLHGDGVLQWAPTVVCEDLADEPSLRAALEALYADSPWVSIDRLVAEIHDTGTHPADARRFYLNQADQWHALADRDRYVADDDVITLGFDGSRGRERGNADATALIGCRVKDGHLFQLGVWQAREGEDGWQAPDGLIDAAVRTAFQRFRVQAFYADPSGWTGQLIQWEQELGKSLRVRSTADHATFFWPNRTVLMGRAFGGFEEAVTTGALSHDGSYRLTEHVLNARRAIIPGAGIGARKEYPDSPRKIDACIAAVLAWQARSDLMTKSPPKRGGSGRIVLLS
jgi:phage terminase large subunit-like protein